MKPGRVVVEIGDARFVLLGEATHGTHEFYIVLALEKATDDDIKAFSESMIEDHSRMGREIEMKMARKIDKKFQARP